MNWEGLKNLKVDNKIQYKLYMESEICTGIVKSICSCLSLKDGKCSNNNDKYYHNKRCIGKIGICSENTIMFKTHRCGVENGWSIINLEIEFFN